MQRGLGRGEAICEWPSKDRTSFDLNKRSELVIKGDDHHTPSCHCGTKPVQQPYPLFSIKAVSQIPNPKAHSHLQIITRGIDDNQIILLVAFSEFAQSAIVQKRLFTFDRVGLDKLGAVDEERFRDGIPCHAFGHAEVDVGGGELVDVKPDVLGPGVADEFLV